MLRGIILKRAWGMLSIKVPFNKDLAIMSKTNKAGSEDITGKLFKIALKELSINTNPANIVQTSDS
jgi:hypothetical protein